MTASSRRRWIGTVALGSLALAGAGCSDDPAVTTVDLGPADQWTATRWRLYEGARVILARDARGLFAMSAACPHQGCVVSPVEGPVCLPPQDGATSTTPTLCCACHGSTFDGDGLARTGPAAPGRLQHWRLSVVAGRVMVRVGDAVASDSRVMT